MKHAIELFAREALAAVRDPTLGMPRPMAVVAGAIGAAIAIALMELLAERTAIPLLLVPFATSIVLVMGSPQVAGGAAAGAHRRPPGGYADWAPGGEGHRTGGRRGGGRGGSCIVAMHLTRSFHPPAGIDPLVVVLNGMSWGFLLVPVAAGACLLAAVAFVWHNFFRRGSWPKRWW
jgi:CBS-domain-containing membrane protein